MMGGWDEGMKGEKNEHRRKTNVQQARSNDQQSTTDTCTDGSPLSLETISKGDPDGRTASAPGAHAVCPYMMILLDVLR